MLLIPAKEVLSLLPAIHDGDVSDKSMSALFDGSATDLYQLLLQEPDGDSKDTINSDPRTAAISPLLVGAIGEKFILDGADQYFVKYEPGFDQDAG